jgi:hypothetical protein
MMEVEFNHLNHATYRAECRAQDAEFSRPQILGARILCHDGMKEVVRAYIRNRELTDQQLHQLELKISAASKSKSSSHPLKPPLAVPNQTSSSAGGYWRGTRPERWSACCMALILSQSSARHPLNCNKSESELKIARRTTLRLQSDADHEHRHDQAAIAAIAA